MISTCTILYTACDLAYCGSGGTCKNATGLSYHCECKEGFSNVLNMTTMPCFQDCKIIRAQATSHLYSQTAHLSSNSRHHFRFLRSGLRSHRDPTIHKLHFYSTTSWLRKRFKQLPCTCSRYKRLPSDMSRHLHRLYILVNLLSSPLLHHLQDLFYGKFYFLC